MVMMVGVPNHWTIFFLQCAVSIRPAGGPKEERIIVDMALLEACKSGDIVAARHQLLELQADPNQQDELGRTPLLLACSFNRADIADLLLGCPGIRPDLADLKGCTPLQRACRNGGPELLLLFREHRHRGIGSLDRVVGICRQLKKDWILDLLAGAGEDEAEERHLDNHRHQSLAFACRLV